MKNSLYDSKKSNQNSSTGYTASYIDKYRKKTTKPNFQLDKFQLNTLNDIHHNTQSHNSFILNTSFQNSLHSSFKKQKPTESKVPQNQWIGQTIQTSNKHKNVNTQHSQEQKSQVNQIVIDSFHLDESLPKKSSNILIEEQIQQDISIYQQYRMLEEQYQQQLDKIKQETDKIQQECSLQRKRIAQSEQLLFLRKKKLRQLQDSYEKALTRNEVEKKEEEAIIKAYEQKLHKLKTQQLEAKQKHSQEIYKLQNQLASTEIQNQRLQKQLRELETELQQQNLAQSEQTSTLQQLELQETALLQDIASLEQQQANLQRQMQELQQQKNDKPISNEMHKKYLQIYEKMFITNQLHKAQEILRLKDQEKHQMEEIEKRKSMIKDKKVEISLKQKRIAEKNKMIDKLTQQIREKSTTLLNLYQQQ